MRWLVLVLLPSMFLLLGATRADAKIVIMEPPVPHLCRSGPTWPVVDSCLKKIGKLAVLRDTPDAKLVTVGDDGVYLYVRNAKLWVLGGMYEVSPIAVIDLHPVTINKHAGYRVDLGVQVVTTVGLDEVGGVAMATIRTTHALFCSGDGYRCADALTQCDVLVHGKSYFVFRGHLTVESENIVHVDGDRTRAGAACSGPDRLYLGWTPQPG